MSAKRDCRHRKWTPWERRKASFRDEMIWIQIRNCVDCGRLETKDVPIE